VKADVIIIGAGAAGLMCAIEASKRGRKVLVLESSDKAGKKILISGGILIPKLIFLTTRIFVNQR